MFDSVLGATLFASAVSLSRLASIRRQGYEDLGGVGLALLAVLALCVALRSRVPLVALAVSSAAAAAFTMREFAPTLVPLLVACPLYSAGASASRRRAWSGLAISALCYFAVLIARPPQLDAASALMTAINLIAVWMFGATMWSRRMLTAARLREAHREIDLATANADRAMAEVRAHVARELHDVMAHTLSAVTVQARVASHLLNGTEAPGTKRALDAIVLAGTEGLTQLRGVLARLRDCDLISHESLNALAPTPTLADLDSLSAGMAHIGVKADLRVRGDVSRLAAGTSNAAYRIVQEALTNVARHAGDGVSTSVDVDCGRTSLRITVRNGPDVTTSAAESQRHESPATEARYQGQGIAGMRERARLWGGTLEAARSEDGGFTVTAELPLP